jgi:hypothetical protein
MFVQVIHGTVDDADLFRRQTERWAEELEPSAPGFLGSTSGVTPDGRAIILARFESEADARANSDRHEQAAWWNETEKAFRGPVTFHDCRRVDTLLDRDCNQTGFVQIIQGSTKKEPQLRARLRAAEPEIGQRRPEILGMTVAWHGDGSFTQAVYFTSEQQARRGERVSDADEVRQDLMALVDQPTYFDLPEPDLF